MQLPDSLKKLLELTQDQEIKCTCRDDDKYARPLCPVCGKEEYDRQKTIAEELKRPKNGR